jgi:hypothetical protein
MLGTDIELGDYVRDQVSGMSGIVFTMGAHVSGCTRVGVRPTDVGESRRGDQEFFYAGALEHVDPEEDEPDPSARITADPKTDCAFELGQRVEDVLTGYEGQVSVINYKLFNTPQLLVVSLGEEITTEWVDDVRLEAVTDGSEFEFTDDLAEADTAETGPSSIESRSPNNARW